MAAARGPYGRAQASVLVRTATRLRAMPATAAALAEGRIGVAKARLLAGAWNERTREAFARDEDELVAQLEGLSVDQAGDLVRFWSVLADDDGAPPHDAEANRAHLSQTRAGRWRLDGDLDAESGTVLSETLGRIVEELRHGARRPGPTVAPAAWRAEALVEMARRACAAGADGAARPLVWVVVGPDGSAFVPGVGPLRPTAAARLACDAAIRRLVVDGAGRLVDLGRSARFPTPTQRRLLWLRDGGCTFPGCGRPPAWTEAHHIVWWESGGGTDLENLTLMCSHCHHLVHEGGWSLQRRSDGELEFRRPDGSILHPPRAAA
jgi:hypothetical protein